MAFGSQHGPWVRIVRRGFALWESSLTGFDTLRTETTAPFRCGASDPGGSWPPRNALAAQTSSRTKFTHECSAQNNAGAGPSCRSTPIWATGAELRKPEPPRCRAPWPWRAFRTGDRPPPLRGFWDRSVLLCPHRIFANRGPYTGIGPVRWTLTPPQRLMGVSAEARLHQATAHVCMSRTCVSAGERLRMDRRALNGVAELEACRESRYHRNWLPEAICSYEQLRSLAV